MRHTWHFARGLGLAITLTTASQLALAATPRHKKPAHTTPKKSDDAPKKSDDAPTETDKAPAKTDDAANKTDDAANKTDDAANKMDDAATKANEVQTAPKKAASDTKTAPTKPAGEAETAPTSAASDAAEAGDVASLGRREAARLAAGRFQVVIAVNAGVGGRHFKYSDPIGYSLAPYRLSVAPMAGFELEAYPAASTDIPVLRDLGFSGHVSRAFAFDSNTPQHVTLETSWTRFGGELRQRLLVPGSHPFELGVLAGADASYFGITAKAPVPALLPSARSVALRFGFDTRLLVAWRLSLLLGGAYLAVTSRGEIYEHFRRPSAGGVDSNGGFAVDVGSGFEARLTGRYTRYFSSFKPALGDRYVAGGALDELWQFGLGVRYAH
jgi:hypothetical protein